MRSEEEIIRMLKELMEQAQNNRENHTLMRKLSERYLALLWVIKSDKAPKTLTFSPNVVDLLNCLY